VDERRRSLPHHDVCEPIGSDSAPVVVQSPAEPPHENPRIVFYGDEQQLREGFAIALCALGLDTNFLPIDIPIPTSSPNREDN
jgi:hypothetical protein